MALKLSPSENFQHVFIAGGVKYKIGMTVLLKTPKTDWPWICEIVNLYEDAQQKAWFDGKWYFAPHQTRYKEQDWQGKK